MTRTSRRRFAAVAIPQTVLVRADRVIE